jgi:NH3-dependent NAD+ synthetase
MDTSDPDISFDDQGVCNHCRRYAHVANQRLVPETDRERKLSALVEQVRADGKGKPYDCIIGVSGGVDSTYLAYVVKRQLGL